LPLGLRVAVHPHAKIGEASNPEVLAGGDFSRLTGRRRCSRLMRTIALRLTMRPGSNPMRTLVRFAPASKRFFTLVGPDDKCSRPARKVAVRGFVNQ
jgi:hypothetical protein